MKIFWVGLALWTMGTGVFAQSPLYWAVANNDASQVWKLTADAPAPEVFEENGLSLPAWAVQRGSAEVIDVLGWRGVPLDTINAQGENLLFGAAKLGRLDLFYKIQTAGARVDQVDHSGRTLVHAAALSPHPEMLQTLLGVGLDAVTRTELGVTPLMLACLEGRESDASLLLSWGAVPEDEDYLGRKVRDYAVLGGDEKTLELIDNELTPWTIGPDDGAPLP